ncbi:MAG: anchored repeat-type ABC transporter permease subunit [Actinomyces sp.]|uniref:anchored repeat-type ABC transporter permease subunit n=1 Tax=Actinomyces sp. oral taxon 181 TaxID=712121 RepID=UPI00034C3CE9|nr:anchored repeat-type ABC transporter permease subunit [Actinomyces sp. oral taxon 181]MBF0973075.1 anchored repeat-type ABC transporter permease subunit [Actinomyces sp.]MBS4797049.1 anchored repeat-type ABC transporter permease subunit [Actinomyces sp. oral taxon 181]MDU3549980.1 anchored repeat-type ABC transporter permease subunit [Actinomyces sp.]MDU5760232.1 anchored repeat-type ABC transporter permease subunit [Actinomyces sp.]
MLSIIDFLHDLTNPALAFLPRAILVTCVAACVCAVVGCHVVLRGMSFIGDAVAHSVFPGLAIAFVCSGSLVLGGTLAGVGTAVLVALLSQNRRLKEDSIIGVLFVGAFGLGLVIISWAPGYAGSLQDFLFGSLTGIPASEVPFVLIASAVIVGVFAFFHKEVVAVSLDRESARVAGLPVMALDLLVYISVAGAVVISVQIIGNILVLALLITPAASARLLTNSLGAMIRTALVIGVLSSLCGIYLSWSLDLPAGASIVCVVTLVFIAAWVYRSCRSRFA